MTGRPHSYIDCPSSFFIYSKVSFSTFNIGSIVRIFGLSHFWWYKATLCWGILNPRRVVALRPALLKRPESLALPKIAGFTLKGIPARSAAATTVFTISGEFFTVSFMSEVRMTISGLATVSISSSLLWTQYGQCMTCRKCKTIPHNLVFIVKS